MKKNLVEVVFDRRKISAKKGYGFLEVQVYLGREARKYVMVDKCSPDEWENIASSPETLAIVEKCKKIIAAMDVLEEERTIENFMYHFKGEEKKSKEDEEQDNGNKNFITFMEMCLDGEELREGTRRHKKVVIDAVRTYGKLNTYKDLTPKRIMDFDNWLHNGTRTDITCFGYHKKIHKWVRQLYKMGEIKQDPYDIVTIKKGKSKEREPLTENELKVMRCYKFTGKLERVRDLFIFAAYTGLSFCDTQAFDFSKMTKKEGGLYYIDGSRIKTDTKFFTPILAPALDVLKKYDYKLPHISNQKANDYLHLIQMELHIRQNLTFHMRSHNKIFCCLNINELSTLKNVTANDLETSYILFLSQLCNIKRTLLIQVQR